MLVLCVQCVTKLASLIFVELPPQADRNTPQHVRPTSPAGMRTRAIINTSSWQIRSPGGDERTLALNMRMSVG
jgi:hypothetical protein